MMRERLRLMRATDDEGTTLIEIMAGLAVMGVFLALFSGTMFSIFRSSTSFESATITSSQTSNAFTQMDKLVRYASSISSPSTTPNAGGNYYVELQTSNTGTTVCTQLQLNVNSKQLKSRTWTVNLNGGYSNLTSFRVLANGISPGTSISNGVTTTLTPFVLAAGTSFQFEQLTVNFASSSGNPPQSTTTSVIFSALNSTAANVAAANPTTLSAVCQETNRP